MKNFIPYILCCCLCATLSAQTSKIDSLEHILASGGMSNLKKAELLETLSIAHLYVDSAKSRLYAMESLAVAKKNGLISAEATAYVTLANHFSTYLDTAMVKKYTMETLKLAQNNKGLELQQGKAHSLLGIHNMRANRHYLAHVHLRNAEKLFLEINNKRLLDNVYRRQMMLFDIINDKENTIYYANKLVELSIELDDPTTELFAQFVLGGAQSEEDFTQESLDFFLDLHQKSVALNSIYTLSIMGTCGQICLILNRPREALHYLHKVRESFESGGWSAVSQSTAYINLAEAYAMLHRVDSAEYYLGKAMNSSLIYEDIKIRNHYIRSLIASTKGDHRSAMESFKKYHHLTDSLHKAQKTADITRMKNWYELEQKDLENELLQQEKQTQQRWIWILSGMLVVIFALFALSIYFYRKSTEKNLELKKLNTVKDKLFSVVAHDLRSPMGALISILKMANKNMLDAETQAQLFKDITRRVDETYGLLENLLRWAKSQMQGMVPAPVSFDAQEASLTVTDAIQYIAGSKNIALNNYIENHQVFADRDMFYAVVRNLTMNAIKYTSAVGEVTLASEISDNMLVISVKDNGTGMPQEVQDKLFKLSETHSRRGTNNESGTGLGLVLCADFAKANSGNIWFTSKEGEGSTFYFSIPLNS